MYKYKLVSRLNLYTIILFSLSVVPFSYSRDKIFTPTNQGTESLLREDVVNVILKGESLKEAQKLIDDARSKNPEKFIHIELNGALYVDETPLRLRSKMSLIMLENSKISHAKKSVLSSLFSSKDDTSQARSLVLIDSSEFVSIFSKSSQSLGVFDGANNFKYGIEVRHSTKINVDNVALSSFLEAGIKFSGEEYPSNYSKSSLTRCLISKCKTGLILKKSTNFVCLDNTFIDNTACGIENFSDLSIFAGNSFVGNQKGFFVDSNKNVITRNYFANEGIDVELSANNKDNKFFENELPELKSSITTAGAKNIFFKNDFKGKFVHTGKAGANYFVSCESQTAKADKNEVYFNPPTLHNPHNEKVIVPGMGRFDLEIKGGKSLGKMRDILSAQEIINKARVEHKDKVLVIVLIGYFKSTTNQGLKLPDNSCVILKGVIQADFKKSIDPAYSATDPSSQVVTLATKGFSSFSGGYIDGGRQAFYGVNATNGSTSLIDHVNISAAARDGVHTKGRGSKFPLFIRNCTVTGNKARGIWVHVAGNVHSIGNLCVGNRMDGIDLDAYASNSTALFNTCNNNERHGIFVEEAVNGLVVLGNSSSGNISNGIHVWNEAVKGNTGQNSIIANFGTKNMRGLQVGGRNAEKTTNNNLFFNNVCKDNRLYEIVMGNHSSKDNYFSQSVVSSKIAKLYAEYSEFYISFMNFSLVKRPLK